MKRKGGMLEESRLALILALVLLALVSLSLGISIWTALKVQNLHIEKKYSIEPIEEVREKEENRRQKEEFTVKEEVEWRRGTTKERTVVERPQREEIKWKSSADVIQEAIAEEQDARELRNWVVSNQISWEELPQEAKDAFIYDCGLCFDPDYRNYTIIYLGDLNSERAQKSLEVINKVIWASKSSIGDAEVEVIAVEEINTPDLSKSMPIDGSVLIVDGIWLQENPSLVMQSIENYLEGRRQSGFFEDGISGSIVILGKGFGPIQTLYQYIDQIVPGGSEVLLRKARGIDEQHFPEEVYYFVSIYFEPSSHYPERGYSYYNYPDPCDVRTENLEGFEINLYMWDTRYLIEPEKPSPPDYVYGPDLIEDLWKRITVYALGRRGIDEC